MAFMNARKRNKVMTYIIVGFVSAGLLLSVSLYWTGGSFSGSGGSGSTVSTEYLANQDFEAALKLLGQGKSKDAANKFASAIQKYEEVLKTTPDNILVLGDLATSYHYTGNTDKAIELVKKALEINPDFSTARMNYAIYLFEGKQNKEEAIKELGKIGKEDPNYQRAQELIASFNNSSTLPSSQSGGTLPPPPQSGAPLPPPPSDSSVPPQPPKN